jgi:hypothetical protein
VVGLLLVAHLDALPIAPALFLVIIVVLVIAVVVLVVVLPLPVVVLLVVLLARGSVFACPIRFQMLALVALEQTRKQLGQTKVKRMTLSFIAVVESCWLLRVIWGSPLL